jgi:hypothetical protein
VRDAMNSISTVVVSREVLTLHGAAVVVRVANFSAAEYETRPDCRPEWL